MVSALLVIGVFVLILGGLSGLTKRGVREPVEFSYRKKQQLLTNAEQAYLSVLERAVVGRFRIYAQVGRFRIYAQVRMADVLEPQVNVGPKSFAALNRVAQKHFDFVLCDPATFEVLVAIELNDSSHDREHRKRRDAFVVAACRSAGLPLIMQRASFSYDQRSIESSINDALGHLHQVNVSADKADHRHLSWNDSGPSGGAAIAVTVAIVLLLAGWHYLSKSESISPSPRAPAITGASPKKSQQKVIDQQQTAKQVAEQAKLESALQEVERVKLEQAKELAWRRYYQPSEECQTTDDWDKGVSCGNQHIRARQKFEAQWDAAH
jgi:hypothetical protein